MKNLFPFALTLFFLVGCSSDSPDSTEEMEEIIVNLPSLSTAEITEISETSAEVGGTISNDGGANVTKRGVVWSLSENPTTTDNKQSVGTGSGSFTTSITDLETSTVYFVRAYAINSEGTAYGDQQQFTTLNPESIAKIFEGDVFLNSQQEVDEFGAQGYTEINGFLKMSNPNSDIWNVTELVGIQIVRGKLEVRFQKSLESLDGFEELTHVGGGFTIQFCDILTSMEGIRNIEEIGAFTIDRNESLIQLPSFSQLTKVESLGITSNNALLNINNFNGLSELDRLAIADNERLQSITDFNSVERLEFLVIADNFSLEQLDSFNKLKIVSGDFPSPFRELLIKNNPNLKLIEGFEALEEVVHDLNIYDNSALTEILTFQNLIRVGNDITIYGNESLLNISTFLNLTSCNRISLFSNPSLLEITGFGELLTISESISIFQNENLKGIDSFGKLITLGEFGLGTNVSLNSLEGFESLKEIQNDLGIGICPNLSDFSFSLEKIGGNLAINETNISDLAKFPNLLEVGGDLRINSNPLLTDFCDITSLVNSGFNGNCTIQDNGFNPTCQEIADGVCR